MILDGQNFFSALSTGDSPTAQADDASAYVIDQQVKGGLFTTGGGAEIAPFLVAFVQTSFASGGAATIQAVLQDSPDNVTYTDQLLGTAVAVASASAGKILMAARIPRNLNRYLRVVWRIGAAAMTAGTAIAFLTLDADNIDLSQRKADPATVAEPSGASDLSVANGVLAS